MCNAVIAHICFVWYPFGTANFTIQSETYIETVFITPVHRQNNDWRPFRAPMHTSLKVKKYTSYHMYMFQISDIRRKLAQYEPQRYPIRSHTRQAAVAVIVRDHVDGTGSDILFIKRATVAGDPWSGQMAFPGGHRDSADDSLKTAAMRETLEETGLALGDSEFLGELPHRRPWKKGPDSEMIVAPFVFGISKCPQFQPNHEVDELVWGSVQDMYNRSLHDTEDRIINSVPATFNGYRLQDRPFCMGVDVSKPSKHYSRHSTPITLLTTF